MCLVQEIQGSPLCCSVDDSTPTYSEIPSRGIATAQPQQHLYMNAVAIHHQAQRCQPTFHPAGKGVCKALHLQHKARSTPISYPHRKSQPVQGCVRVCSSSSHAQNVPSTPDKAAGSSSSSGSSSDINGGSSSGGSGSSSTDTNTSSGSSSSNRIVQLPPPCDLGGAEPQARWNPVSLAYLGDAIWEAYLRSYFYGHGGLSGSQLYNSRVAAKANTHAQASCYRLLLSEGWARPNEQEVLRWAANSSSVTPPKHATRQQYKQATALEALVAYLYLKDSARLQELMDWLLDRVVLWRSELPQQQAQQQQQQLSSPGVAGQQGRRVRTPRRAG